MMSIAAEADAPANIVEAEGPVRKLWTEEELYRLCEMGFFGSNRVELIDGEILITSPAGSMHNNAVMIAYRLLRNVLGESFLDRIQMGIGLELGTEPQPDILFVQGGDDDFWKSKPATADLLVEVSDTSLKYDCGEKADLYAKHGIPDYWVVDIKGRRVLVHRDPKADSSKPRGASYQSVTIVDDKGSIEPLAKPGASVRVADLLP